MDSCKRKNKPLLTLTERKTSKEIIGKIDAKASEAVTTITPTFLAAKKKYSTFSNLTWKFIKGAFLCKHI